MTMMKMEWKVIAEGFNWQALCKLLNSKTFKKSLELRIPNQINFKTLIKWLERAILREKQHQSSTVGRYILLNLDKLLRAYPLQTLLL